MADAYYSNTAVATTLTGSISSGATSINVGATTGFPGSFPYTLAVDYGSGTEELVSVTSAAGLTLTVTRGHGGTSAQSHSLGAAVRHVYHAGDATDFRTHQDAAASVHGVTGALVGATQTQTLTNKTLTSPTINNGALSGTFTGTPAFSGAVVLSGTPSITNGAALAGTFTGTPTLSGAALLTGSPVFERALAADSALRARVSGDSTPRFNVDADGKLTWGSGSATGDAVLYREAADVLATDDTLRVYRALAADSALSVRVAGDTANRLQAVASGELSWGAGGASAVDTNLYRSAANTLKTDDSFVVGTNFSALGIGQELFARKTADTARATASVTDDPHLSVSVSGSAVYVVTGVIHFRTTDATNADITIDWSTPTGSDGIWIGIGQGSGASSTDGTVRTMSSVINAARGYGADTAADALAVHVRGLLVTTDPGTYAMAWARSGGSGTLTVLAHSYIHLQRVA